MNICGWRLKAVYARLKLGMRPINPQWPLGRALMAMRLARSEYQQRTDKPDLMTKLDACLRIAEEVRGSTDHISRLAGALLLPRNIPFHGIPGD